MDGRSGSVCWYDWWGTGDGGDVDATTVAVGTRVVVRRLLRGRAGPSGGPAMTDVVGRVVARTGEVLRVERRDGELVDVAMADVVTLKQVPDGAGRRRTRPARSVDADTLTRICTRGWPPHEAGRVGDWELRAAGGFTGRANSAALHGEPGRPAAEALAEVVAFYQARGLPPKAQAVVGSPGERWCLDHGWVAAGGSHPGAVVQVADLDPTSNLPDDPRGIVVDSVTDDWLALYGRAGDVDPGVARAVLEGCPVVGFVRLEDAGELVAIGRVAVTGDWAGLGCVEVAAAHRRRGHARRVVEASLAWAIARGAVSAYLQTMRHNTAALRLYRPYGFVDHHDYRYLVPPP